MRNTNSANRLTHDDICSDTSYNIYDIDNADDLDLNLLDNCYKGFLNKIA